MDNNGVMTGIATTGPKTWDLHWKGICALAPNLIDRTCAAFSETAAVGAAGRSAWERKGFTGQGLPP